ncbi:hypothetical protein BLL52_1058 [Rhodoferax antarcticus ANT.BR]|uniref:Uncharacterized protein n=1 Tax=Rhodoferax antarcticus ANT.BR TaxID=1111071 RepID=A0A1Q8YJ81_9BURK|nr:hypothetical protein BLL52_1058 [Rhodoferax antarcticus ANT.BR]
MNAVSALQDICSLRKNKVKKRSNTLQRQLILIQPIFVSTFTGYRHYPPLALMQ